MTSSTFVTLDPQRRVSLGKLIPKSVSGFLVDVDSAGVVTMRPASPVPDAELSSEVIDSIVADEADIAAGGGVRYTPGQSGLLAALSAG